MDEDLQAPILLVQLHALHACSAWQQHITSPTVIVCRSTCSASQRHFLAAVSDPRNAKKGNRCTMSLVGCSLLVLILT